MKKSIIFIFTVGSIFFCCKSEDMPAPAENTVSIRHASDLTTIAIQINIDKDYLIGKDMTIRISLPASSDSLAIWECIQTFCLWDRGYLIEAGKEYKIVDAPTGAPIDLILELE